MNQITHTFFKNQLKSLSVSFSGRRSTLNTHYVIIVKLMHSSLHLEWLYSNYLVILVTLYVCASTRIV